MIELLKESTPHRVTVARDGREALAILRREGPHADAPRPDIILLDLNMPRKDGRELLVEIKADQDLSRIPVIVLSSSNSEQDILKSYSLHANCYIVKPVGLDQLANVLHSIESFWLSVASLSTGR
jgi:CheY-like chemotaxis protein